MTGWLALVAALCTTYAAVASTSRVPRVRYDLPMLLMHLAVTGVGGWLIAHDAAWIPATLLAAGAAAFHTARLRQATTNTHSPPEGGTLK